MPSMIFLQLEQLGSSCISFATHFTCLILACRMPQGREQCWVALDILKWKASCRFHSHPMSCTRCGAYARERGGVMSALLRAALIATPPLSP